MRTQDARVAFSPNHHGLHRTEDAVAWSTLASIVKGLVAERESAPQVPVKGKKRAGQKRRASPTSDQPAAKKRKAEDGSGVDAPSADHQPVFCLRYRLGYRLRDDEDNVPADAKTLCALFKKHGYGGDEDIIFQLPDVTVQSRSRGGRLRRRSDDEYLMFLPPPNQGEDHLYGWATTIAELNPGENFIDLSATARVVIPANSDFDDESSIPFHVEIDVTLAFIVPHIFEEPELKAKAKRTLLLTARSELLQLAFPAAPLPHDLSAAYGGRTDIPFFYATVQPAPPLSERSMVTVQPDDLNPTLLPFQRRTVGWLLSREGKALDHTGSIVDAADLADTTSDSSAKSLPLLWNRVTVEKPSGEEVVWYYERLTDTLIPDYPVEDPPLPGAILAEEPGLGKTLECISLMLLNPGVGRSPAESRWDAQASLDVKQVKTSLIVTPSSLLRQWVDEISLHAPTLKVFVYEGWSKLPINVQHNGLRATPASDSSRSNKGKSKATAMDVDSPEPGGHGVDTWAQFINGYDVCITTYNVLQQDLHVARAPPRRPRRETAEYSTPAYLRPRSPLVCVEFFRVIMDEVQMVGGGRSLEMVSLIPRHSSLAVSGTPARTAVSDLSHVLRYLRSDPLFHAKSTWDRLLQPSMVAEFVRLMQYYTCRTMKAAVKDELTIPQQTRYLVPIELGRVERHVYDQELGKCLQELGLDARGVAATENWEIDTGLLRSWLRKLRMICTHPQVGTLQNSTKNQKTGVLKSMEEVLDGMREQNWQNLMTDRRQKVEETARSAQLVQHNKKLAQRHTQALDLLKNAEAEAQSLVDDIQSALNEHAKLGEALRAEYAQLRREREVGEDASDKDKGKGKARARSLSPLSDVEHDEDDDENDGLPKTPKVKAFRDKRGKLKKRMRDAFITLHKAKFLQGDAHHVLGASHDAEENAAYADAERLRKNILKLSEEGARSAMAELSKDYVSHTTTRNVKKREFFVQVPLPVKGGIKTADLVEQANEILVDGLNAQTTLLWTWRTHLFKLLTQSLNATESDSADGEEYSRGLNTQGEADVYVQAYKALLADRREILVAERTALAEHEFREKKKRKTKTAAAVQAQEDEFLLEAELEMPENAEGEVQPEHEVLYKELTAKRKAIMVKFDGVAVKSIVVQTANVAVRIASKNDPEKVLAQECTAALKQIIATQSSLNEKLEADLVRFRKAFNERVQYYKQLQSISDSLKEAEWSGAVDEAIEASNALQAELDGKIKTGKARERYLQHLTEEGDDEEDGCILCRCEFNRGYLTECAHSFCEDCMKGWLSRHNKVCPVCRVPIDVGNLQRFTVKTAHPVDPDGAPNILLASGELAVPRSRRRIDYNSISHDVKDEIESFEVAGSYGSKIETLVRHLLYLRITDPGAKSIVFSAFEDSLHIVEHALRTNDIPCLRIESTAGSGKARTPAAVRFKQDPDLLVLLLHGERENAGLNVTCASRVFLLESVVHHSFEVQAIARIDRMGQTRPTEVFCYYAEETVEKNILDLAARKGLSLYTAEKSQGTLDVAPAAMAPDAATNVVDAPSKKKDQKGDFIFKLEDMMTILFPHLTESLEYLLPTPEEEVQAAAATSSLSSRRGRAQENAAAGPSRLR